MAVQTITAPGLAGTPANITKGPGEYATPDPLGERDDNGFYGGSQVFWQMQAFDSVTDARYFWVANGSPDWAGSGYPGPNSPTDIAVAGRLVIS